MQDQEPIIVQLIDPARPLLKRTKSPLHTIYSQQFNQLPNFEYRVLEDEKLHSYYQKDKFYNEKITYTVYQKNVKQVWDFSVAQKRKKIKNNKQQFVQKQVLEFDSNFESGNLKCAQKVYNQQQYNLQMQKDINTYGYTQWFFYKVTNSVANKTYKFNINNFYKSTSLYQKGMKILVYSIQQNYFNRRGWYRDGQNIQYYKNEIYEEDDHKKIKCHYTLSFNYTFKYSKDQVYFASNYPYTYTQLNTYLEKLEKFSPKIIRRNILTRTLAGNKLEILTITNNSSHQVNSKKNGIIIIGRIHPGQTVSSYIVKGIIDYLTSQDEEAYQLRQHFIFKIVPMVNPDGVIHGNYRTNLSGSDLNRKWQKPNKTLHPEIYYLKKYIIEFSNNNQIVMFCDMHGHSKKKNAFIYGCNDKNNPYLTKQFPFLISKASKFFSFEDCSFGIKQDKKGTARAVFWKTLKIPNVFTLQTSFCGPTDINIHFSYKHFEQIGKRFCQTLLVHFNDQIQLKNEKMKSQTSNESLFYYSLKNKNKTKRSVKNFKQQVLKELYSSTLDNQNSSSGSDSDPQCDKFEQKVIQRLKNGIKPIARNVYKDFKQTNKLSRSIRQQRSINNSNLQSIEVFRISKMKKKNFKISEQKKSYFRDKFQKLPNQVFKQKNVPYSILQQKVFSIIEPVSKFYSRSHNNYHHNHFQAKSTSNKSYTFHKKNSIKSSNQMLINILTAQEEQELNRRNFQDKMYSTLVQKDQRTMLLNKRVKTQKGESSNKVTTLQFSQKPAKKVFYKYSFSKN